MSTDLKTTSNIENNIKNYKFKQIVESFVKI